MKTYQFILATLLISLFTFSVGLHRGRNDIEIVEVRVDSVVYDTIVMREVSSVRDTIVEVRSELLTQVLRDTITREVVRVDTIEVIVPMREYIFDEPNLYKATIRGYGVTLEEMEFYPQTIHKTQVQTIKPKRWVLSVGIGFGVGRGGLTPMAGILAGYKLWEY